ncbi:transporter [Herminiimonas sp. CN]|uniref:SphA family protein n=1 Tax=Herminiimonas sp. CN TaxID=1349818 RepID=UPI0004738DBC|nr:transporter [Herminiimonas sp. CN]
MRIRKISYLAGLAISGVIASQAANATEGGGSTYPMGAENYLTGVLPPPGLYPLVYLNHYSADKIKDNNGNDAAPPNFKVSADVVAPRLIWVTGNTLLGGQVAHALILPLVNLDVRAGASSQSKTGIGDLTITSLALGYHYNANLHSIVALDIFVPTGRFNKTEMTNIGRNYWGIQPVYAVSYIDPAGWNADFKLMYDFNLKNTDTNYKSGQELHVDYSLGYGFKKNWVVGVGGYAYKQTANDEQNGVTVANNKGQAFAIGPSIKYDNGKGMFVTAKWQKEMNVENRAEGQAFWIKALLPF